MEREISFNDIFVCFKKHWWKVLAFALLAAILMGCFTHFFITKKYSSKIEFYIINTNDSADFAQTSILSAAVILANDYIDIIKGDVIMNEACKKLEEKGYSGFTPNIIRGKLSASTSEDSSLFTIQITDSDPERAYDIACVLAEISPTMITDITKPDERTASVPVTTTLNAIANEIAESYPHLAESIRNASSELKENFSSATLTATLDNKPAVQVNLEPKLAKTHHSPNLISNCILAAIIGAIASFAFFVLRSLLNTTIRTEEDVTKSLSKYPLIGTVPFWELSERSGSNTTNYKINR